MNIKLVNKGSTGVFLLDGRLDSNSYIETQELLMSMVDRFQKMVLDFQNLQYISSAGLRVMRILHIEMSKKNGEFVLTNVNSSVMDVFEMTGFSQFLNFE